MVFVLRSKPNSIQMDPLQQSFKLLFNWKMSGKKKIERIFLRRRFQPTDDQTVFSYIQDIKYLMVMKIVIIFFEEENASENLFSSKKY